MNRLDLLAAGLSESQVQRLERLHACLRVHPERLAEDTSESARLRFWRWLLVTGRIRR